MHLGNFNFFIWAIVPFNLKRSIRALPPVNRGNSRASIHWGTSGVGKIRLKLVVSLTLYRTTILLVILQYFRMAELQRNVFE